MTGKFGTAIELLVTFAKENEEDAKEIKGRLHGLVDDLEATEREIQLQEAIIRRKKQELTELESRLFVVKKEYKAVHPNLKKRYNTELEQDMQQLKKRYALQGQTFQAKVAELAEKEGNPEMRAEADSLDQLVARELKLAGKKALLSKVAEGVFMIGGRVCQVKREKKKELFVTFVDMEDSENAVPERKTLPIKRFIGAYCSESA